MLKLNRIYETVNRYVKGQFGTKVLANTLNHAMTNTLIHLRIIGIMPIIRITGIMAIMEMMNNEMIH